MKKMVKGLYPHDIPVNSMQLASSKYGIAAGCDSFYEYLLKMWVATKEQKFWDRYYESAMVR